MDGKQGKGYQRSWKNLLINKRYQLRFTLFMVGLSTLLISGLGVWALSEARKATTIGINDIYGRDCRSASPAALPGEGQAPAVVAPPAAAKGDEQPAARAERAGERPRIHVEIGDMTLAAPEEPGEPAAAAPAAAAPTLDESHCKAQQEAQVARLEAGYQRIKLVLIGFGVLMVIGLTLFGIKTTHKVAGPLHKVSLYFDKVRSGRYDEVYSLRKGDQLVEFYEQFKAAHAGLRRMEEKDIAVVRGLLEVADAEDLASRSPELAALIDDLRATLARKEKGLE